MIEHPLLRFESANGPALGALFGDEVADLSTAQPTLPADVSALLAQGDAALQAVAAAARHAKQRMPLSRLKLLPPAMAARKILCLGLNYRNHAAELAGEEPEFPMVFMRSATTLVGHGAPLVRPAVSEQLDWEGELVAFIGRRARHVPEADALDCIAGYSVFNDGSVRDYQRKTSQWTVGKNFDATGGFGPAFVPASRLPAGAKGLRLQTRVNGTVVQEANTNDMLFSVARTVALLSQCMTLEPGDLLVMGTPAGVGAARTPPVWLKPGDVCEVEIEQVGLLRNPVAAEAV